MDTAPVPNIVPIPGMAPGEAVAAGSGASGGDDGDASKGDDKENAGTGKDGKDAEGDNRDAPDPAKNPTCGTESHPVDVVTGRVFTHPITDLELPGPLPFTFARSYSSKASREDQGLGLGWAHSLGWFVQVFRDRVRVWNELGVSVSFAIPEVGHTVLGDWGWVVRREADGFAVDANDDVWRFFTTTFDEGVTYKLSAIQDRNKNRIALTYDKGQLALVTDSAGRTIKVTPTKEGRIASIQVKNAENQGRWIAFARYEYDDKGRLVRVTDADDYSWTYEYDEFDRLVRDTDRCGLSFCFKYDNKDRGIEAWGEYAGKKDPSLADDVPKFLYDGHTRAKGIYHRKLDYHPEGYTEVTDTTETRRYFGNRKGTLDKAVTGGAVTTSKYDDRGFEIEKTDPMRGTWRWMRDERGRVLEAVDPLGRTTRFERDPYGSPVEVVDPAGGVTRAWRDQHGNVEAIQGATGSVWRFERDTSGRTTSVVDPAGSTVRYAHDAHGSLAQIVQPNGGAWHITSDFLGRRMSFKDPAGAETRYVYSDRGDLIATYHPDGGVTRYAYDGERHLTQVTTPKGHTAQFTWGGFHHLCSSRDANGHVVRLQYSREGELVAVLNQREESHRIHRDSAGGRVGETTFDGRELRYRNDATGRLIRAENAAGEITTLVYDLAGQLVERQLPDGSTQQFEYDPLGALVSAKNADGECRFVRDAAGRIVRELQRLGDDEHWVEVSFGPDGLRSGRRTSLGHSERIERDAMGARLQTWLDGDRRVEHASDVLAREVRRQLPGGGTIESAFDPMGRLSRRLGRSPGPARAVGAGEPEWMGRRDDGITTASSYSYDLDGELVGVEDRGRGSTRYEYDPVGHLLAVVPEVAKAEVFRFDPTGNPYEAEGDATGRVYGAGNRVLRRGTTEYEWDAAGRLAAKREHTAEGVRRWTYAWNGAGLLASVDRPDGRRVEFVYDALGRRLEKSVSRREGLGRLSESRTRFVWDRDTLVHEIRRGHADAPGAVRARTYWFEDDPFVPAAHRDATEGETREWVHYVNEPSGMPSRLLDGHGSVVCELHRTALGGLRPEDGATEGTALRMRGQYEDEETGLSYNRWRYYDAELGRFVSADPIGLAGGPNYFAAPRNTIRYIDPYGLAGFTPKVLGPGDIINRGMKTGADGKFQDSPLAGAPNANQKGARACGSSPSGIADVSVTGADAMVGPTSTPPVDGHFQGLSSNLSGSTRPGQTKGSVDVGQLPAGLQAVQDGSDHVAIVPAKEMTMGQFQTLLNQVPWK
jgi:RHS repeat-associated protein